MDGKEPEEISARGLMDVIDQQKAESNTSKAGKKDEAKAEKKKKADKIDFAYRLQNIMNGYNFTSWPEFTNEFHVASDATGVKRCIEVDGDKVCRYVGDDRIVDSILHYCHEVLAVRVHEAKISYTEALGVFKLWKALTKSIDVESIEPIAQKDEDVLCWHRLPFNFAKEKEETPFFDEMFSRITNAPAIKAFIGSLFFKESDRQQYVWIYGRGSNGKSALARFLHDVFGPTYSSQQPPAFGDRFWLSGILGARLVVFPDCNDGAFPTTGLFKSITGSDSQRIEEKGKPTYTAKLNCKIMFFSNETPSLSGINADRRRAIYSEISPITSAPMATNRYQSILWNEAPGFIYDCIETYRELSPNHDTLPTDTSNLDDIVTEHEEPEQILFDKYFYAIGKDVLAKAMNGDKTKIAFVTPDKLLGILKEDNPRLQSAEVNKFKRFMENRYGIKAMKVFCDNGVRSRRYLGVCTKQEAKDFGLLDDSKPQY